MMATAEPGPPPLRFSVLGPVQAWRGPAELDLGARQSQLMLALLLVRAGQLVAVPDFVDLLWGEDPPSRAVNVIHRNIGFLRRVLEPGLPARATGHWLDRRADGYQLRVGPASLDLLDFRRLAGEARRAEEHGDTQVALALSVRALDLWRGRCAEGLVPPATNTAFSAVDRERAALARDAADLALACHEAGPTLPALRSACERSPFDEALHARLMLLLAANGQRAEAIMTYRDLEQRLADELGVDPGTELRDTHDRILAEEPRPQITRPASHAQEPAETAKPAHIPSGTGLFSGRDRELAALSSLLLARERPDPGTMTILVEGLPGAGKTTLAIHWAHQVAHGFPDGALFVNLRGFDPHGSTVPPAQALAELLSALGIAHWEIPPDVESRAALYRSATAGRRILIILDNARDADQIRPLLPASKDCVVLVTSRNRLTGLVAREGAHRIHLDLPTLEEARVGLLSRLGLPATGHAGDAADVDWAALDEIIATCGRLPLATAVVGARVATFPNLSLREAAEAIRADHHGLEAFSDDDPLSDVRSVFSWSYQLLTPPAARLFRLLSLHPGPDISLDTAASLIAADRPTTNDLIGELTGTGLLTEHRHRRYLFHDLVRTYAMELTEELEPPNEHTAATDRLLAHLYRRAHRASQAFMPRVASAPPLPAPPWDHDPDADVTWAMTWFTAELDTLEKTIATWNTETFHPWEMVLALQPFYKRTGRFNAWATSAESALQAAITAGDIRGQAHMLRTHGGARNIAGQNETAQKLLARATALLDPATGGIDLAHVEISIAWLHYGKQRSDLVLEPSRRALDLFQAAGDRRGEGHALLNIAIAEYEAGELEPAIARLRHAIAVFIEVGDDNRRANCFHILAKVYSELGHDPEALHIWHEAARLHRHSGNMIELVRDGTGLGDGYLATGAIEPARSAWREALTLSDRLGLGPYSAGLRRRLTALPAPEPAGP